MLRILGVNDQQNVFSCNSIEQLRQMEHEVIWYWLDLMDPDPAEKNLLEAEFHFHPLAIEDCGNTLNNPKMDFYDGYHFLVLNELEKGSLQPLEVTAFISKGFLVTYHEEESFGIEHAMNEMFKRGDFACKGPAYVLHQIVDKIVDEFFPALLEIEDRLNGLEINSDKKTTHEMIDEVFGARKDLLKLRKTVNGMRDLVYRILNSERIRGFDEHNMYFSDIHDHLLKLTQMIEENRELTSDIRDSYLSLDSAHMNRNMMVLTVMTTIFIPLTFIVGVYGMNFEHMPELGAKYGYYVVLGVMLFIGFGMFWWFKKKGWFDI